MCQVFEIMSGFTREDQDEEMSEKFRKKFYIIPYLQQSTSDTSLQFLIYCVNETVFELCHQQLNKMQLPVIFDLDHTLIEVTLISCWSSLPISVL